MKQKILLFAFTLLSTMLFSQAVPMAFEDWKTTMGTQNFFYKNVTKTDLSGNIYVAGATVNGAGNTDILLAKYSSAGVQLWIQQYAGAGLGNDFATDMFVTSNAIYLTGGVATSTASPTTDVITMKYNLSGVLQWVSTYNGAGNSFDAGRGLAYHTQSNTLYVSGGTYNTSLNSDILAIAYNSSGTQLWANTYNYTSNLDDAGVKIAIGGSTVAVTGAVTSSTNNYKNATITFDKATGTLTAVNISTAVTTSSVNTVTDLVIDASNNYYVVGSSLVSGQGYNYYVQKLNSSLITAWTYTYNGASNLDDIAKGVQVDASGNVYITGYSTSSTQGRNIVTIKLNSSGTNQWTQTINGSANGDDEANDMVLDVSANVYITGYTKDALNNKDYYTAKYNTSGTKLWEIQTDGNHLNDQSTNIALDSLTNVIVTGQTETATNSYNFTTCKYVQKDVITPTDFSGEKPKNNFMFYSNKGQLINSQDSLVPDIKFYTFQTFPSFYFKNKTQCYVFSKVDTVRNNNDTVHRIDLNFNSSNEGINTYCLEQQKNGYLNYYLAHTPNGVAGVFGNKRLITPNLYNNIDLMTTSNQNGIKYYFIVKPGGDMRNINLEYTGATSYSLSGANDLTIKSIVGSITFSKPIAYQLTASNTTVAVTGWTPDWQTNGASNKYKFNSGTYTSSLTLVIEVVQNANSVSSPTATPVWGTSFSGSSGDAESYDITIDKTTGNLFTTGYTSSAGVPYSTGPQYQPFAGSVDAFMSLFDWEYAHIYTNLYGGASIDKGYGVTYDKLKNKTYICGVSTGTTALIKPLAGSSTSYTNNANSNDRCFIARFDANTGFLEWSTKYGVNMGYGKKIKADANGNFYVIGDAQAVYTTTTTCTANNSPYQHVCNPGGGAYYQPIAVSSYTSNASSFFYSDGYIARFNSSCALTWATFFGGDGDDNMQDIQVDDVNHKLYLVGGTYSTFTSDDNCDFHVSMFPICNTAGTFYARNLLNGNNSINKSDGFIAKFNLSSLALEGCSYFGGSNEDVITDVTTDNNNNVFITGYTKSSFTSTTCSTPNGNFPICKTANSYTQNIGGGYDAFVAKFTNGGNNLVWSTFIGGTNDDFSSGIVVNTNSDDIYAVGNTKSCGFPTLTSSAYYQQTSHADSPCSPLITDGYVCTFANDGGMKTSTFFGGKGAGPSSVDYGDNIAAVASWMYRVYVGGGTYSTSNFPFACPNTFNPYWYKVNFVDVH